jgi:hypothetical protein
MALRSGENDSLCAKSAILDFYLAVAEMQSSIPLVRRITRFAGPKAAYVESFARDTTGVLESPE